MSTKTHATRRRPAIGTVFEIPLPDGRFAYGRLFKELGVGIYRQTSADANKPPIGSRDYSFMVPMYREVLTKGEVRIVGKDAFIAGEDEHLPPKCIRDVISGRWEIYHKGKIRPATEEECRGLEREAVWDLHHIVDRIMHGKTSKYLISVNNE